MLATSVILYVLLTLAVGVWSSRKIKITEDFTLAGRSLPAAMVAVTLFATWFGPELIMGVPTLFLEQGIRGIITDQFGNSLCLIIVGFFFAKQLYKLNISTVSDFFRLRYGANMERISSILCIFTYFSWIAAMLIALALLFSVVLGLSSFSGILLGAGIIVIYTFCGGMWAISITDLIQTIIIVGGLVVLAGHLFWQSESLEGIFAEQPEGFFDILPQNSFVQWADYFSSWMYFGIGAIPAQEVYQIFG